MCVDLPAILQNENPELQRICKIRQRSKTVNETFWLIQLQHRIYPHLVLQSLNSKPNPPDFTPLVADGMYVAVDKYGRMRYGLWSFVINQMVYDYVLGYYDEHHNRFENSQEVADEIFRLALHPEWMKMNHGKLAA